MPLILLADWEDAREVGILGVAERRRSTPEGPPHGPENAETAALVSPSGPKAALKAELEPLGNAITLLAVVLCILGLLTVNAYLYHDGVSEFTLLRPRFVYAGWWVALVLTTTLIMVVLVSEEAFRGWFSRFRAVCGCSEMSSIYRASPIATRRPLEPRLLDIALGQGGDKQCGLCAPK